MDSPTQSALELFPNPTAPQSLAAAPVPRNPPSPRVQPARRGRARCRVFLSCLSSVSRRAMCLGRCSSVVPQLASCMAWMEPLLDPFPEDKSLLGARTTTVYIGPTQIVDFGPSILARSQEGPSFRGLHSRREPCLLLNYRPESTFQSQHSILPDVPLK